MKTTALLIEDHDCIRRVVAVLQQMGAAVRETGVLNIGDAQHLLNVLQQFADNHHQGKEEGVFFPALLKDRTQKNHPLLCALVFEHNRERSLLEGLEEAIRFGKPRDFVYYAGRLAEVFSEHMDREERETFVLADAGFSKTQDEELASELMNYERAWRESVMPELMRRLEDLEAAYTTRNDSVQHAHNA